MSTQTKTEIEDRQRMLIETKANIIEMRSSLARSMDVVIEHPDTLNDEALLEMHMASGLLLEAVKQVELGTAQAKLAAQPKAKLEGDKVA